MTQRFQLEAASGLRTAIPALEDNVLMYMPAGMNTLTPSQNGKPVTVTVIIDAKTAATVQRQYELLCAAGKRPYFSVGPDSHKSSIAAFWPRRFFWDKRVDATGSLAEGVWVEGEWSKSGREAVEGRDFRSFSPTFFVDEVKDDPTDPARVICVADARPNMGALENDPAFANISPLTCRNASGEGFSASGRERAGVPASSQRSDGDKTMTATKETLAELQARKTKLEKDVGALEAKSDAVSKADLRAAQAEIREINALISAAEINERADAIEAKELTRRTADADHAVECMVASGKIKPREDDVKKKYRDRFINDPGLIELLAGDVNRANAAAIDATGRMTPNANAAALGGPSGGSPLVTADLRGALRSIAAKGLASANRDAALEAKFAAAKEIGRAYKEQVQPLLAKGVDFPLLAADYVGTSEPSTASGYSLGILSGTLVAQRTLDLYKFQFPVLSAITTDFSEMPAQFGQTTVTRIIVVPAVLSYNSAADSYGRPIGYQIVTPAQTVDAPINLNYHRAVDVVFDANTLAATTRNLFGEQAEANAYAIGLDVVNNLYAVITPAAFAANAPFSVPVINFGRPTFSRAKRVFNLQGVPFTNRFALSSSYMQEQLEQDPTLVSLAVFQKPEIIEQAELPPINRFIPYEAPNLPATAFPGVGNGVLAAFFAHRTALLMQARIPNDWSTVLGTNSGYGMVSVVTNPDTGLSVLLVQFSNPQSAHAEYRLALMYGVAVGNNKGGLAVTN